MKKILFLLISILLFVTSCAPKINDDEVLQNEKSKEEASIVPSYQLSKNNYRMILPYRPSEARGVIVNQLANRVDIDSMEEGLRRHSKEYFDPEKYYFEEGQYLKKDVVYNWLERKLTKEELEKAVKKEIARLKKAEMTVNEERIREKLQLGLNPAIADEENKELQEKYPKYLSHILEQNFLEKKEDNTVQIVGLSLGISMKSVYRFSTETGGPYYKDISKKKMLEEANKIAKTVLERVRKTEGLEKVPVMIAIYREASQDSPVPGNFVAKTYVEKGHNSIDKWESIQEEHILFPSNKANEAYFDDAQLIKSFTDQISKYFPNYVGVIGEGFYINKELRKLTIDIPIEFYGKAEVIGFTQYTYGVVKELFPDHYELEINVTSSAQQESLIYRQPGEKNPVVHIFH
ncbi:MULTISPECIES: CamS family sex pheromone protein [unclassified Virgibacillus]|uniref:CamS family sex pheromone protein n=1 Tax=unclassified Virgibacillus TaxID=2620237 RepID=UPI0024DEF487|nr:CamS family sex pheromone protein [Virgibacillus sp. LDC-1]